MSPIITNTSSLNKAILSGMRDSINQRIRARMGNITKAAQSSLEHIIENDPTWAELSTINSELKKQLGIPYSQNINSVLNMWTNNLRVDLQPVELRGSRNALKMKLSIKAIKKDYSDVLPIGEVPQSSTVNDGVWNWLAPIVGNGIDVEGYHYRDPNSYERYHFSRGGGFMAKKGSWQVDGIHKQFIERVCSKENAQYLMGEVFKVIS